MASIQAPAPTTSNIAPTPIDSSSISESTSREQMPYQTSDTPESRRTDVFFKFHGNLSEDSDEVGSDDERLVRVEPLVPDFVTDVNVVDAWKTFPFMGNYLALPENMPLANFVCLKATRLPGVG